MKDVKVDHKTVLRFFDSLFYHSPTQIAITPLYLSWYRGVCYAWNRLVENKKCGGGFYAAYYH